MSGKPQRLGSLLILSCLIIGLRAISTNSVAARSTTRSGVIASGPITQSPALIRTYWTSARMQAARSAGTLLTEVKLTRQTAHATSSGSAPPVPSGIHSKPIHGAAIPPSEAVTPNANALPHSSYSSQPYATIGRIFFTDPQTGYNYACSGTATTSINQSVVDTAGHCVVAGGSAGDWYTNWVFCPQYYYGKTPYGCWTARYIATSAEWYYSGSFENDFADVAVWANSYGKLINVVGGAGWAFGQSTDQFFYPFGYPAASPFDGNAIFYCASYGIAYNYDTRAVISTSCDMTGGSSGGPWLISLNGSFGYINGHNDFKRTIDPYHIYSPYYDINWYNVFNAAQNA